MSIVDNPLWQEYKNCCEENNTKPSLLGFVHWNPDWNKNDDMASGNKNMIIVEWVK